MVIGQFMGKPHTRPYKMQRAENPTRYKSNENGATITFPLGE
jgi:hypothetical protein